MVAAGVGLLERAADHFGGGGVALVERHIGQPQGGPGVPAVVLDGVQELASVLVVGVGRGPPGILCGTAYDGAPGPGACVPAAGERATAHRALFLGVGAGAQDPADTAGFLVGCEQGL